MCVSRMSVIALLAVVARAQEQAPTPRDPAPAVQAQAQPQAKPGGEAPARGEQITESQLAGLPLNGRSYSQLATLQAGVTDTSAGSASRGVSGGSLTVAGSRSSSNNFLLDGTNIMDADNQAPRSAAGVQLGSDAILQVQVFSTTYGAEYGRGSGGVLNSLSRSGSSEFHGTAFEYFRNSKMDARNFFDGAEAPPFKRNQFGATFSGPAKKDATFFLASFEALRDRLNATDVSFFPDAAARQGFPDASGAPTVAIDPRVRPYLDLYPMPNDLPIGRGVARNRQPQFLATNETFFTVRVDQKITSRDSFFVHYTFDDATSQSPQDTFLFKTVTASRQQYLTLLGTHVFSPRTLSTFRAGYTRPALNAVSVGLEVPAALAFVAGAPQFGQILVPGINNLGPDPTLPKVQVGNTFQFAGDLLLRRGAHSLKTGLEVHRYRWDLTSDWNKGGVWSFNSLENFLRAGPVGTGVTVTLPGSNNTHAYTQVLLGAYVQDEYRVNPHLSWNAGLRYEFASKFGDRFPKMIHLADLLHDTAIQYGDYFSGNPSKLSFAPRLGFTWSPGGDEAAVVGGGFGVFYDQILTYVPAQRKSSAPFYNILVNPNSSLAFDYFPNVVAAAGNVPPQVQVLDYYGTRTPMVLRYTLSVQKRLPGGWRMQAGYVGARGNRLFRRYEANQFPVPEILGDGSPFFPAQCVAGNPVPGCRPYAGPVNPAFGAISLVSTDAQSFYNSLQISASRGATRNLSLQASYSYSKSVDDASNGVQGNFGQYALMRTLDRGLSDFDVRHRLVLNYFYSLPLGAGQHWMSRGMAAKILGGWRLGGIASLRSGVPFSPAVSIRYKDYLFSPTRPNLRPSHSNNPTSGVTAGCGALQASGKTLIPAGAELGGPELYFDPCAFEAPAPGTLGNAGRNTMISANVLSMDLSIQRDFLLDSRRRLQFRGEMFNFINHTNLNPPSGGGLTVLSGESPTYTSRAGRVSQTNTTSRQIQFALRLSF